MLHVSVLGPTLGLMILYFLIMRGISCYTMFMVFASCFLYALSYMFTIMFTFEIACPAMCFRQINASILHCLIFEFSHAYLIQSPNPLFFSRKKTAAPDKCTSAVSMVQNQMSAGNAQSINKREEMMDSRTPIKCKKLCLLFQ